jgi:hypothetical protein
VDRGRRIEFPSLRVRPILTEHARYEARRRLAAEPVVEHRERSNFEIDEESKALWQRPPSKHTGEATP